MSTSHRSSRPAETQRQRLIRLAVAGASFAIVVALFAGMDFGDRGYHFERDRFAANVTPGSSDADGYDLRRLRVLTRCVGYVRANYVDPGRANAREMLVSALSDVERKVPEFMADAVRTGDDIRAVHIRVGDDEREFSLTRVADLYTMSWKLLDIFEFVAPRLAGTVAAKDIEYAAINGMLRVLDPHSTLLTPSVYREMKLGTTGKFGGLGIVITQRDGKLVVQSVMEGTPAREAGLKSGDIITQIGAESTVNMSLNQAVKRLRGEPGTAVTLWIQRKTFAEPRKFRVVRANITLASVTSKLLDGGLGYARIKNFQQSTADDLKAAIERMTADRQRTESIPLSGMVLDLRDNPGGLLDQAIEVSDLFLANGTIVTTVGSGNKVREEKVATVGETWATLPVVVLVNEGSASASEIVAGALRNHDRALVVGTQTFGKGSVQVIYDIDDAALKLTVAQYLTPGDESIQSVGITPHVELLPVVVDKRQVHLNLGQRGGENELENHLSSSRTKHHVPDERVNHLLDDNDEADFALDLGSRVLLATGNSSARSMLAGAKATLEAIRKQESARVVSALGKLDIDWNRGRNPRRPKLEARLKVVDGSLESGEKARLVLEVENTGRAAVYRVRGRSTSDVRAFDDLDFPLGRIPPGETRRFTQDVDVPRSMASELVGVSVALHTDSEREPLKGLKPAKTTLEVTGLPRPRFAYTVQVLDHEGGNGDSRISADETVTLRVRLENVGRGAAHKTLATLKNRGGEEVFITQGREWVDGIAAGQSQMIDFKIQVKGDIAETGLEVDLQVTDSVLRQRMTHTLDLPIARRAGPKVTERPSQWVVEKTTAIRSAADVKSVTFGAFEPSTPLFSDARIGDWLRIPVEDWGYVWVTRTDLVEAPPGLNVPQLANVVVPRAVAQPDIALDGPAVLETQEPYVRLKGRALFPHTDGVRPDLYIFRDDDKVFFGRATPQEVEAMPFDADIPLNAGRNQISIHARAGRDLLYKVRMTVQRTP